MMCGKYMHVQCISRDGYQIRVYYHKLFLFAFLNKGEGFDDFDPGLYTKICFEFT